VRKIALYLKSSRFRRFRVEINFVDVRFEGSEIQSRKKLCKCKGGGFGDST